MCQIEITPDRLKHFPKTVPMNIREAILIVAKILIRIHMEQATKTAPLGMRAEGADRGGFHANQRDATIKKHAGRGFFP